MRRRSSLKSSGRAGSKRRGKRKVSFWATVTEESKVRKVNKEQAEETFWKTKTFIDLCYGDNDLDLDEMMSMFWSNFTGEEIVNFRISQRRRLER